MNRGLFGFDGLTMRVGVWRSPYVPLSKFTTAKRYVIAHPFDKIPATVIPCLRCKISEGLYQPGQETLYHATDWTQYTGCNIRLEPDGFSFIFNVLAFDLKNPSTGTSFATTPANWDLAFVVLG